MFNNIANVLKIKNSDYLTVEISVFSILISVFRRTQNFYYYIIQYVIDEFLILLNY